MRDGWSDPQRRPLINFIVVSESGPMFIKSIDCSSEVKNKQFIANLLKEVIDEVGHQKVVQVIIDNASNCKETNEETYDVYHSITEIHGDALQIKNFIMNHSMRLAIYNWFSPLKLLSVADTHFASIVVMLKRFKLIRYALEAMVMSDQWAQYGEDDQGKARFVHDKVVDEDWWENGKEVIFDHERKQADGFSPFYYAVHRILVDCWAESNTPFLCLAHSLNPRFYSEKWLQEGEGRVPPHMDGEVSTKRIKCFRRIFSNEDEQIRVNDEFANFSLKSGPFANLDSIGSMYATDPRKWWACFGSNAPLLQRGNKLTPKRAEDLVFIHNNLRLLSRNSSQYYDEKTRL
ncbi:uncharacterized protein LOC131173817 [Hevea brasiliensis]|uniref:uncharacterized protein LOC131173817 n=1 Tax=Hevea brasiliensis TaxID=3981 RepID=UPI0025DD9F20|nr:uncharacterized protein LOC131173817 [Hevea brasiliensis]